MLDGLVVDDILDVGPQGDVLPHFWDLQGFRHLVLYDSRVSAGCSPRAIWMCMEI